MEQQKRKNGFASMSPEQKREISSKGGQARHKKRGFSGMSLEKRKAIASKGGKAAHSLGVAHQWTSETASEAGRKGGAISRRGPTSPLVKLAREARRQTARGQVEDGGFGGEA